LRAAKQVYHPCLISSHQEKKDYFSSENAFGGFVIQILQIEYYMSFAGEKDDEDRYYAYTKNRRQNYTWFVCADRQQRRKKKLHLMYK
jgi:hypothetical protein